MLKFWQCLFLQLHLSSCSSPHCWMDPFLYLYPLWTPLLHWCSPPAPTSPDASWIQEQMGQRSSHQGIKQKLWCWTTEDWKTFTFVLEETGVLLLEKSSRHFFVCLLQGFQPSALQPLHLFKCKESDWRSDLLHPLSSSHVGSSFNIKSSWNFLNVLYLSLQLAFVTPTSTSLTRQPEALVHVTLNSLTQEHIQNMKKLRTRSTFGCC